MYREELPEVDCYSFLSLMVSPPADSGLVYLTQSRRAWDLAAATLKPLALQYIVSSLFIPVLSIWIRVRIFSRPWAIYPKKDLVEEN
jgi:hypothetical protein